jgi:hypothetical protein
MIDIKRLHKNIYSIPLTRGKSGYNNYLKFISGISEKYPNYTIKINLKIEYLYGYISNSNKDTLGIFKKKQCSSIYFSKQMDCS